MTEPRRDPWLLTPGPLTTSRAVKEAMLHDWGSRDVEFIKMNARVRERLVSFVLDDPEALPWGDEPIWCEGAIVGSTTSAAYGHTLSRAVAMGYVRRPEGVDAAYLATARFEIEIGGLRFAARGGLRAPYDPDGTRVKS